MSRTRKPSQNLGIAVQSVLREKKLTQDQFAQLVGWDPSKVSRMVNGENAFDADTVDRLLAAFPDKATRFDLVSAYLRDVTSPNMRAVFAMKPREIKDKNGLDGSGLSPRAVSALQFILKQAETGMEVENLFTGFAQAIGWTGKV